MLQCSGLVHVLQQQVVDGAERVISVGYVVKYCSMFPIICVDIFVRSTVLAYDMLSNNC